VELLGRSSGDRRQLSAPISCRRLCRCQWRQCCCQSTVVEFAGVGRESEQFARSSADRRQLSTLHQLPPPVSVSVEVVVLPVNESMACCSGWSSLHAALATDGSCQHSTGCCLLCRRRLRRQCCQSTAVERAVVGGVACMQALATDGSCRHFGHGSAVCRSE
jgi:hypothetical protein